MRRGAAPPVIPVLREKEKEKKRGAVMPWVGGPGPGVGVLSGGGVAVRVGSSLAMRTGLLSRLCAALSRLLGGPGSLLGDLFASGAGRWLVGAALSATALLLIAAAARLLGPEAEAPPVVALPMAEPPSGGVRAEARSDRSLDYVVAPHREDAPQAGARTVEAAVIPKDALIEPAPELEGTQVVDEGPRSARPRPTLSPMGWGRSREGFGMAGGAGGDGARGSLGGPSLSTMKLSGDAGLQGPKSGKLRGLERARRALSARRVGTMRGRTTRAMGQLKLANAMSMLGAGSPSDQNARSLAGDAFDQTKSIGGGLVGITAGSGIVDPLGNGAPDLGVTPGAPDLPPGVNVTPYQGQVDNARGLGDQAAALKKMGEMLLKMGAMLMMMGIALMAAGAALMAMPPPANAAGIALMAAGAALLAAGGAMMSAGMGMLAKAQQAAQQAKDQGKGIEQQYGQPEQGKIVGQCAQQSANTGVAVDACQARNPEGNEKEHANVKKAVADEGNAGFEFRPAANGPPAGG